jgi:8-oxo-dGTP pyrophosphatase MutT (NUDIX family)
MWNLPGGRREGQESPEDYVLRELKEEFGLSLAADCGSIEGAGRATVASGSLQKLGGAGIMSQAEGAVM